MCAGVIQWMNFIRIFHCICICIWIVFLPTLDQCECAGVLFLPLHQPPTSESCLPVALDCRGEERHRRNQNTQMFSQLVERTFEWKERNWGKCWTWLFERLSGINQGPGWIYWTAVSHLTFTFNQFSFLTLTNSLIRNFRFPRYHHPASDSH